MKNSIISALVLAMTIFACRKSNYTPPSVPVVPVLPDTLMNWK
jgi:hypothetical protein